MALPVLETVAVWLTGASSDRAVAVQAGAPPPWAQYHDLRWLLMLPGSWAAFAGLAVVEVVVRAFVTAVVVAEIRGAGAGWRNLRRSALLQAAAGMVFWLLVLPWALLAFTDDVVSISWLVVASLPPVIAVSVASAGAAAGQWWGKPTLRTAAWALAVFAFQSAAGAVMQAVPAALWVPVAAGAGVADAWAWIALASPPAPSRPGRLPLGPAVGLGMLAVAVGGAALAFAIVGARAPKAAGPPPPVSAPKRAGPAVMVVGGFDSTLGSRTVTPDFASGAVERFSYAGLDSDGNPRPYTADDTHRSIGALARMLAAQVSVLRARTGRPVALVAESEGSLIAEVYLASDMARPDVQQAVLLSPLIDPARVGYPVAGRQGAGIAAGAGLEGLSDLIASFSPVDLPAGSPFLRSIVDHSQQLRTVLSCPLPVPITLLEPLADSVAAPVGVTGRRVALLPAWHGGLLTNRTAQRDVERVLEGGVVHSGPVYRTAESALRLLSATWQVPSPPLAAPPCPVVSAGLRNWITNPNP